MLEHPDEQTGERLAKLFTEVLKDENASALATVVCLAELYVALAEFAHERGVPSSYIPDSFSRYVNEKFSERMQAALKTVQEPARVAPNVIPFKKR